MDFMVPVIVRTIIVNCSEGLQVLLQLSSLLLLVLFRVLLQVEFSLLLLLLEVLRLGRVCFSVSEG